MAVFIILPLFNFSQNNIYQEIYNLNTFVAPEKITMDKTIISFDNNIVYSLGQSSARNNDLLKINRYDTKSKKLSFIKIKKTKELKDFFSESIYSFIFTEKKVVFLTSNYIFIFSHRDNECSLISIIKNERSFNKVYRLNSDELFLYVNYNFHPLDVEDKHLWAKLNINDNSITSFKKMDNENTRFSYFVNDWISVYNGLIAYAQTSSYCIKIYNQDFHLIDSIKSNQLNENISLLSYVSKGDEYSADEMNLIRKADDTLLTRIQKIFLLDSTHLLVMIKLPKTKNLKFDIWEKRNNIWEIKKTSILPSYYELNKKYDESNNFITGFFGNYDGLTYANKNEFYFFYFPFIENIKTDSFDRKKDYDEKINGLTRKKELYYGVKKIKVLTD